MGCGASSKPQGAPLDPIEKELLDLGWTVQGLKPGTRLEDPWHLTALGAKAAGYTPSDVFIAGYSDVELHDAGLPSGTIIVRGAGTTFVNGLYVRVQLVCTNDLGSNYTNFHRRLMDADSGSQTTYLCHHSNGNWMLSSGTEHAATAGSHWHRGVATGTNYYCAAGGADRVATDGWTSHHCSGAAPVPTVKVLGELEVRCAGTAILNGLYTPVRLRGMNYSECTNFRRRLTTEAESTYDRHYLFHYDGRHYLASGAEDGCGGVAIRMTYYFSAGGRTPHVAYTHSRGDSAFAWGADRVPTDGWQTDHGAAPVPTVQLFH